jgi:hypothetical protein
MNAKIPHAPTTVGRFPIVYEKGPADFAVEDGDTDTEHQDPRHQDSVLEEPEDRQLEESADDDPPDAHADANAEADVDAVVRRAPRVRPLVRRGRFATSGKVAKIPAAVWAGSLPAEPVAETPRPRSVTRLMVQIVPAVALVALSVLFAIVWRQNADLSDDVRQRRSLNSSAGKVASTFFNWDYQHMDQSFAAKYPLLTKAAGDAIRPTAATLTSYFTTNKVSSAATISGIYPGDIKGDGANVMVIINTKVTTAKSVQSNTGATVAISMKRVSGRWLAGNITLLSSGVESTTDQNGKPLTNTGGSTLPGTVPSGRPTP